MPAECPRLVRTVALPSLRSGGEMTRGIPYVMLVVSRLFSVYLFFAALLISDVQASITGFMGVIGPLL